MNSSKKAAVNTFLLGMIVLVILVLVYSTIFARQVNPPVRALEECRGECVARNQCVLPKVVSSSRCVQDGEVQQNKVCCQDLSMFDQKEEEGEEDDTQPETPETLICTENEFPIAPQGDPYRYKCIGNNKTIPCHIANDVLGSVFDSCTAPNHPVYNECCNKDIEVDDTFENQITPTTINLKIGEWGLDVPSVLTVNRPHNFYLTTTGADVESCRAVTLDSYGELVQGNLAFDETVEGNRQNLLIQLTPNENDMETIVNQYGQPIIYLRVMLDRTTPLPGVDRTYSFGIIKI